MNKPVLSLAFAILVLGCLACALPLTSDQLVLDERVRLTLTYGFTLVMVFTFTLLVVLSCRKRA